MCRLYHLFPGETSLATSKVRKGSFRPKKRSLIANMGKAWAIDEWGLRSWQQAVLRTCHLADSTEDAQAQCLADGAKDTGSYRIRASSCAVRPSRVCFPRVFVTHLPNRCAPWIRNKVAFSAGNVFRPGYAGKTTARL
jgi:hypothetical protein